MNNSRKKIKKHFKFWTFYKIYIAILISISVILICVFYSFMKNYEKNKKLENENIEMSLQYVFEDEGIEFNEDNEKLKEESQKESEEKKLENEKLLSKMPTLPTKDEIMEMAKTYSLFTSGDLKGEANGIKQVLPFIEKDTEIYKMVVYFAYEYIEGVKIKHTLADPIFINEDIGDYEALGDNEFVIKVSFDKQMLDNDKLYLDNFSNEMIFKYNDKEKKWLWISNRVK